VSSPGIEQFARLCFRKGRGDPFVAIDRWRFDFTDWVPQRMVVAHQALVER
jgi:hypothetical protein